MSNYLITFTEPSGKKFGYVAFNTDIEYAADDAPSNWPVGTTSTIEELNETQCDYNRFIKFGQAHLDYTLGNSVELITPGGSCWCGDTTAVIQHGNISCHGRKSWQQYTGPVEHCHVGYGMSDLAHAIIEGVFRIYGTSMDTFQGSWIK